MFVGATVGATDVRPGVDGLVERLQQDPVLIDPVLGNGHTEEIARSVSEAVQASEFPVYVVMTSTPPGLSGTSADEELASVLHGRIGGDGVYVVQTTDGAGHVGVWGDLDPSVENDQTLLSLARFTARDDVRSQLDCGEHCRPHPATDAALVAEIVAQGPPLPDRDAPVLTEQQASAFTDTIWLQGVGHDSYLERVDPPTPGLSAVLWTSVGIVVAVLVLLGARTVRGLGARRLGSEVDLDALRERVRAELARADRGLARPAVEGERRERAGLSRDAAERLVASEDHLDLVGALVLARTATHLTARRGDADVYRPCYVNPLHGRAEHEADLGGGLRVPACQRCAADLRRGRPADPLMEVRRAAVDRPYYRGDTVWARTGFGAVGPDLWRQLAEDRSRS